MKAKELIKKAFHKVNIFDPNEDISGDDISTGLDLLNSIISQWSSLQIYIPVANEITINLKQNVYEYIVSPLIISVLSGNIIDGDNTLSTLVQADDDIYNTFNYALSTGRPYYVYLIPQYNFIDVQTEQATTKLIFYPVPDQDYTAKLLVKQILKSVTLETDLTDLPPFYFRPLMYELGYELATEYSETLSPDFRSKYDELMRQLKAANKKDYSVKNANPFWRSSGNYPLWGNPPWGNF